MNEFALVQREKREYTKRKGKREVNRVEIVSEKFCTISIAMWPSRIKVIIKIKCGLPE